MPFAEEGVLNNSSPTGFVSARKGNGHVNIK